MEEEIDNKLKEIKCHFCGRVFKGKIEVKSNARGYGYYITCPNCNNENVMQEVEEL